MNFAPDTIMLDHSGEILLLVDPASLAISEVSRPTLGLLGYRREELLGRPITDIECSLADVFFWEEALQGGPAEARDAACSYRCANGDILPATKNVSRFASEDKAWLVVRAEPLASGQRVEERLACAASLLRATLEATADGILLIDRAGAIVNMNQRFARLWNFPEELLGAHDDSAILAFMARQFSDSSVYAARLGAIAPDAEHETFDLLQLADGRVFERKSMPARHGGKILGRVFSFTDISARRRMERSRAQLEAQLREAQKMQALGTLAGGIAHDFNNILATILGNVELACEDACANPRAMESLEEIRKAGSRARGLVQQILSFSRRQPTERRPVALAPIVEEAERLLRATLPARLTLEVRCEEPVPLVLADANQIQQVLINLATNAMQAMRDGPGKIVIGLDTTVLDAALVQAHAVLRVLRAQHLGRVVRLAVSDTGPGMDAATLERIFEPFFTTKAVNEGTGLGLSVVHGIVQAHAGAIVADSQPGKGATFTLYLPVAAAPAGASAPEQREDVAASTVAPGPDGGRHILYLDDDEALVSMVKRLLERRGCRVSGYTDQDVALAALRADPGAFDLVVSDYNMPGMSGLDVARAVCAIRADLPVAVASGFIDEALREQAGGAGVRELIFKADAVEDFCAVVQRLARMGRV